jgi:sporulation protein YlmC with PRC-barrel domain
MILSDILTRPVLDAAGQKVGNVIDVRFVIDGTPRQLLSDARLAGFIVSPRTKASYLGYERNDMNAPAIINRYLAWRHRGTFYVLWDDVAACTDEGLTLRESFTRYNPSWSANG